ncbi:MAG: DegT/DnrJ/EryC1/StrS family aminotransferase [Myxococcota bacterium]
MTRERIPFLEPELPPYDEVVQDLEAIYRSGVFSNGGPFERRFAESLAAYLGVPDCVPVANGTLGLMLAARLLARPDGERRVLLPSFTFPASALAMQWAGLEPVFCDVDPETWQPSLDPERLRRERGRFALVLLCNTFGAPADIGFWRELAADCGLPMLVDSASGLGGRYPDGRRLGGAGLVEVFSMHATKTFGVGEGGVVTAPEPHLRDELLRLRNFGLDGSPECRGPGLNAKLPEIQAAIASRVLARHEQILEGRRELAAAYRARLEPHGYRFQKYAELSPYQCVSVRVPGDVDRDALRVHLESRGIETRHYFAPPLHRHAQWTGCERLGELSATDALARGILSLPTSNRLTGDEVARVCDEILGFDRG